MHIDKANLVNLTKLWIKYGSRIVNGSAGPKLHVNTHWPHRCWFDLSLENLSTIELKRLRETKWLDGVPQSAGMAIFSYTHNKADNGAALQGWKLVEKQLLENQWRCTSQQLAMYKKLQSSDGLETEIRSSFEVVSVRSAEEIKQWVNISSEAFDYCIDDAVIANLIYDIDIQILLAYENEKPVASALLYKTDDIIGLHQMGVKRAFQGQGIAKYFMQKIIAKSVFWKGNYIVLQASQAGKPLYKRLGFVAQFTINNYKKLC